MTVKELITALGGAKAVASKLHLRPSAVRMWIYHGYVPPKWHTAVLHMAGRCGIHVTREDLDPAGERRAAELAK